MAYILVRLFVPIWTTPVPKRDGTLFIWLLRMNHPVKLLFYVILYATYQITLCLMSNMTVSRKFLMSVMSVSWIFCVSPECQT